MRCIRLILEKSAFRRDRQILSQIFSMKRDLSCFWASERFTAGIFRIAPSTPASRRWLKSMRLSKMRSCRLPRSVAMTTRDGWCSEA